MKTNSGGLAFISVTALFFAVNSTISAASRDFGSPLLLGLLRWTMVTLVLVVATWPTLRRYRAALAAEWKGYAVLGLMGMAINGTFPYIAGQTTTATNIGLVASLAPLMTVAASAIALKERLRPVQIAGILLGIVGVGVIAVQGDLAAVAALALHTGDLFVVGACIAWAAYSVGLRLYKTQLPPFARLAVIGAFGALWLVPAAAIEQFAGAPPPVGPGLLVYAAIAALIPGVGGFVTHAYTTRTAGASRAALSVYLMPVFSVLLGVSLLGESFHGYHLAGGLTIMLGVWMASRQTRIAA